MLRAGLPHASLQLGLFPEPNATLNTFRENCRVFGGYSQLTLGSARRAHLAGWGTERRGTESPTHCAINPT